MQAIPPAMAPHVGALFSHFIYTDLTYPHLKSSSVICCIDVIFVKGVIAKFTSVLFVPNASAPKAKRVEKSTDKTKMNFHLP